MVSPENNGQPNDDAERAAAIEPVKEELVMLGDLTAGNPETSIALANVIEHLVLQARLNQELQNQATYDPLTGLFNRRGFFTATSSVSLAPNQPVGVTLADLDNFKRVNDTFGHEQGDNFLRDIAVALSNNIGPNDIIGRIGGDEFISFHVLEADPGSPAAAEQMMQITARLMDSAEAIIEQNPQLAAIDGLGISVGQSQIYIGSFAIDEMARQADANMYHNKPIIRQRD